MSDRLSRYVPITRWLPRYERSWLGSDLLAAAAVWAVLVPQAVAYAALAGAPPEAGLFTALAAGVLYAVFGTCRELEVGPSSTISITAAAALIPVAAAFPSQQYTVLLATLAVLTGVTLLLAGALRLGLVAQFLARPVILGFISGIGVVIIVGQIPNLLGISVESGNVPETIWRIFGSLDEAGWRTALVGGVSLIALLGLRRLAPRVPWALVVAAAAVACSRAFDLAAHGVAVIADVPTGLPSIEIPNVGLGEIGALTGGALALALVSLAESIGAARSLAASRGYEIDPNQELVALGASNVGAGLLQGFPVDASLSRSAVGLRRRCSFPALGDRRRGAADRDDVVPDAVVRRPAAGHARRHHRRCRDRAGGRAGVPASVAHRPGRRAARCRRLRRRRRAWRAAGYRRLGRRIAPRPRQARIPTSARCPRARGR